MNEKNIKETDKMRIPRKEKPEIKSLRIAATTAIVIILLVCLNSYLQKPARDSNPSIESYFSPGGGVMERIIREIDSSGKSIDIAMYAFTKTEIADALDRAKRRKVVIRVIMDKDQSSNKSSKLQFFKNKGFDLKLMSTRTMHNKYAIIDEKILITGSYNWTGAAEKRNFENLLIISNSPKIIDSYRENFSGLWRISE